MAGILTDRPKPPAPGPYEHQPFPSVRYHRSYHKSGKTKTVKDQAEHDAAAADPDWAETPAAFDADGKDVATPDATPAAETKTAKSKAKA